MRVLKANSRKRPGEIFSQLAQGLQRLSESLERLWNRSDTPVMNV
jgi:hypothetical protein